jgi:hypothetical protein
MISLLQLLLGPFLRLFRSRRHLMMENLVLRQQLAVLKARRNAQSSERATNLF